MNAIHIPFITKSPNSLLTFICLGLAIVTIGFVVYLLAGHHRANRKAKELGHNRRHDGRHGNH